MNGTLRAPFVYVRFPICFYTDSLQPGNNYTFPGLSVVIDTVKWRFPRVTRSGLVGDKLEVFVLRGYVFDGLNSDVGESTGTVSDPSRKVKNRNLL